MRSHENSREFDISSHGIHNLLCGEALEVDEEQVDKSLNEREIPTKATRQDNRRESNANCYYSFFFG